MKTVLGIDVGFRTGALVALNELGELSYVVLHTEPPPTKKARRVGELQIADDQAISDLFRQTCAAMRMHLSGIGGIELVYEQPGKGQGARAVEALSFARAAIVCAASCMGIGVSRVTADECERAMLGPNVDPAPPRLPKLPKDATDAQREKDATARKVQKKAKELRRKDRKLAVCSAVGRLFPELAKIRAETGDWSHVVDAVAVLVAEVTFGRVVRAHLAGTVALGRLLGSAKRVLLS